MSKPYAALLVAAADAIIVVAVVAAASVAAAVVVAAAAVIAISIGAGDCRSHRNTDLALAAENADERPVRDLSANRQGVVLQ